MITVPYTPYRKFDMDPKPAWGIRDGSVFFRCACGNLYSLDRWTIDDAGNVTPSVHDAQGCGFHEFVRLEGWPKVDDDERQNINNRL